jgi:hypothetical protein
MIGNDYIKNCKSRTWWHCKKTKKKRIKIFFYKEFLSFFTRIVPRGISQTNMQLLILNGHGSHVTFEIME